MTFFKRFALASIAASLTLIMACGQSFAQTEPEKKDTKKKSKTDESKKEADKDSSKSKKAARTGDDSELTPDKQAAIKELLTVTEVTKVADRMYEMLLKEGQKNFIDNLSHTIQQDPRYTDEQKKDLQEKAMTSSKRMFARYRELLPQTLNLGQVLEEVSYKVYNKYFTTRELKSITAFYKTDAGKKALAVLPQVMEESANMTGAIITPKVHAIVQQVVTEERQQIEKAAQDAAAAAAAAKKNEKK